MFDPVLRDEIELLATTYELEAATLLAVVEVESGGRLGAEIKGRMEPLIRFEGHYFYRLLSNSKRNRAVVKGLAAERAGVVRNPWRQSARWKLLDRAIEIDRPAALASCSWGVGQVMGAHWRWLGYASIDALVAEARRGVEGQVQLMIRYIGNTGLVGKLQNQDWSGFARAYNGPSFRKYKYDRQLAVAYAKHSIDRVENTRTTDLLATRHKLRMMKLGSVGEGVKELQRNLGRLGYLLVVDGDFGPATERMLKAFQRDSRLRPDGIFGPKTLEIMQRKLPRIT
ncbi:MAG: N-acetylmuramidase domain-containing protein [Pseudomonadota bacterium]